MIPVPNQEGKVLCCAEKESIIHTSQPGRNNKIVMSWMDQHQKGEGQKLIQKKKRSRVWRTRTDVSANVCGKLN